MSPYVNGGPKHDDGDHFINPYTFVPLPGSVERGKPRGHASMKSSNKDGYSGYFDWVLRFDTPLILPKDEPCGTRVIKYAGSALRGVLRSLHETLAGGCLRIFDEDFVPVHRQPMAAGNAVKTLAVVTKIDPVTQRVTEVFPCDEVIWVKKDVFIASGVTGLYSGMRVDLSGDIVYVDVKRRDELLNQSAPRATANPAGGWVIHLTQSHDLRNKRHYYVAAGRVPGASSSFPDPVEITEKEWKRFEELREGSRDMTGDDTPARRGRARTDLTTMTPGLDGWPSEEVKHGSPKTVVGCRRRVDGQLCVGDTVWLTLADPSVGGSSPGQGVSEFWNSVDKRLSMATIWRAHGTGAVKDRIPMGLEPCSDPDSLCPSCAVFGSIDPGGVFEHEQLGYASHIRVGWATSCLSDGRGGWRSQEVRVESRKIPPLRAPKPSSGGFYLEIRKDDPLSASTAESHVPRAHWGSRLDRPRLAPLYRVASRLCGQQVLDDYLLCGVRDQTSGSPQHLEAMAFCERLITSKCAQQDVFNASHDKDGEKVMLIVEHLLRDKLEGRVLDRADKESLRAIRGRKYYWMGQPQGGDGRHVARERERPPSVQNEDVPYVKPLTLVSRITFDNLDAAQLGLLLAAAKPSLLLGEAASSIQIGRGKPLGFGQVSPQIIGLTVQSAVNRYAGLAESLTIKEALRAAVGDLDTRNLTEVHRALTRVLTPNAVDSDRVWYPTTGNFNDRPRLTKDQRVQFNWSFEWFAHHSGGRPGAKRRDSETRSAGDMVPLPDALSEDQYLPNFVRQPDPPAASRQRGGTPPRPGNQRRGNQGGRRG